MDHVIASNQKPIRKNHYEQLPEPSFFQSCIIPTLGAQSWLWSPETFVKVKLLSRKSSLLEVPVFGLSVTWEKSVYFVFNKGGRGRERERDPRSATLYAWYLPSTWWMGFCYWTLNFFSLLWSLLLSQIRHITSTECCLFYEWEF